MKPKFSDSELQQMHRYCLKYRGLVRSGKTPNDDQTRRFLLFSRVTYAEGVAGG